MPPCLLVLLFPCCLYQIEFRVSGYGLWGLGVGLGYFAEIYAGTTVCVCVFVWPSHLGVVTGPIVRVCARTRICRHVFRCVRARPSVLLYGSNNTLRLLRSCCVRCRGRHVFAVRVHRCGSTCRRCMRERNCRVVMVVREWLAAGQSLRARERAC